MYFLFLSSTILAAVLSAIGLRLAYILATNRRSGYKRLRSRYISIWDPLFGRARIENDRLPDGVVQAGLVFNKKTGRFEPNGRLSEEALDKLLYNQ